MLRTSRFIMFIALALFASTTVKATTCNWVNGASYVTRTANFNNVYVQRDTPVGTTLATLVLQPISSSNIVRCTGGPSAAYNQFTQFTSFSSISGVRFTNIAGVGLRVRSTATGAITSTNMGTTQGSSDTSNSWNWNNGTTLELVKLSDGATGAGTLSTGKFIQAGIYQLMDVWEIDMGYANIIPLACSIKTPNLNFPIGDVLATKFGSSVGTIPSGGQNTQNLGLNCDAGANINVSLSGTQSPDVSTTSVLALTGQGNSDVAKGVGVQLLYNGSPLVLNNRIVLKQSSGGQETFPLTARYYQTKTSVSSGTANASATLDLTYQ